MSQEILRALMQLFAIIARPESNKQDRRSIVESFLKRQLNQELVSEYLLTQKFLKVVCLLGACIRHNSVTRELKSIITSSLMRSSSLCMLSTFSSIFTRSSPFQLGSNCMICRNHRSLYFHFYQIRLLYLTPKSPLKMLLDIRHRGECI